MFWFKLYKWYSNYTILSLLLHFGIEIPCVSKTKVFIQIQFQLHSIPTYLLLKTATSLYQMRAFIAVRYFKWILTLHPLKRFFSNLWYCLLSLDYKFKGFFSYLNRFHIKIMLFKMFYFTKPKGSCNHLIPMAINWSKFFCS